MIDTKRMTETFLTLTGFDSESFGEREIAEAMTAWSRDHGTVKPAQAARTVAQVQYAQREYADRKPGEMPEWLAEMLKEDQDAQ